MSYPPPTPIPPQLPVPPTTPANLGKVGFQLVIVAIVINTLSEIPRHILSTGSAEVEENGRGFVTIVSLIAMGLVVLLVAVALSLGIAGLIRRERPMWWSVVSVASILIVPTIGSIVAIISFSLRFASYGS